MISEVKKMLSGLKKKKVNLEKLLVIESNLNKINYELKKIEDEEERKKLLESLEIIKLELYQVYIKLNKDKQLKKIRQKSKQAKKQISRNIVR